MSDGCCIPTTFQLKSQQLLLCKVRASLKKHKESCRHSKNRSHEHPKCAFCLMKSGEHFFQWNSLIWLRKNRFFTRLKTVIPFYKMIYLDTSVSTQLYNEVSGVIQNEQWLELFICEGFSAGKKAWWLIDWLNNGSLIISGIRRRVFNDK